MSTTIYKEVEGARITKIEEKENLLAITFDNNVTLTLKNEGGKIVASKT